MTNNLKCPFCGAELEKVETPLPLDSEYLFCPVDDCHNEPLKREIWQALIDGKKAQEALKGVGVSLTGLLYLASNGKRVQWAKEIDIIQSAINGTWASITKQENE